MYKRQVHHRGNPFFDQFFQFLMQYGQPFHLFGQRLLLPIPPVHHETENLLRRAWHRARGVPIRFCKDPSGELFHGFVGQGIVTEQMEDVYKRQLVSTRW